MPDSTLKRGGSKVTLNVNGYEFSQFNNFKLDLNFNSIASVFSFDGFFDINKPEHKRLFKPLSFLNASINMDNRRLITGTCLNHSYGISGVSQMTGVSGYSKTGILEDCNIAETSYPLQVDGLSLKQIAEKLCTPFGISVKVKNDLYAENETEESFLKNIQDTIKKITEKIIQSNARNSDTVRSYLSKLCNQKNVILTHDAYGNLVITKVNTKSKSIATFNEGKPSTNISLSVNGQGMHSTIKMVGQSSIGTDVAVENNINNPLISKFRPAVRELQQGNNDDSESNNERILGNELKNIVLTITTPDWYWTDGKVLRLITPNNIIDVISPTNYMSSRTRWFVESVSITGNEKENTAVLTCVLPEVYSGEQPKIKFI